MTSFYFHLETPEGVEADETGIELKDLDEAYLEACRAIPGTVAELVVGGHDPGRCAFHIAGDDEVVLMVVPLFERVRHPIEPKPDATPRRGPSSEQIFERVARLTRELTTLTEALHRQVAILHHEATRSARNCESIAAILKRTPARAGETNFPPS